MDWLEVDWTLSQFGVRDESSATSFSRVCCGGTGVDRRPWDELPAQIYLGSVAFQKRLTKLIVGAKPGAKIPARQRRPARP